MQTKQIQLSDHFTYQKLLRFTFPSIVMMIFTSIYSVVDGFFVSNFVGKAPFAALNLIFPFLMILGSAGFMIGTGGSALVSMTLGEGDRDRANRLFTMLVIATAVSGAALALFGLAVLRPLAAALGAEGEILEYCVLYGRILLPATGAFMLQNVFQSFFVTAEKPKLGLAVTVAAGAANIVLDALFVAVLRWGLAGAAAATAISQIVGGLLPVLYFALPNSSLLRLTRTRFDGRALLRTCANGSSELMSNVSMSLVSMLYNFQLLRFAGEDGVAAYGVIMYVNFIFAAVFLGYSIGCAPVVGYHYGAGNREELRGLLRRSLTLIAGFNLALTALAELSAPALGQIFVSYDATLLDMTVHGFRLYAISFLFAGINVFGSAFFTALNNGLVSAVISFARTLIFQLGAVALLPLVLGLDGVWLAIVLAELLALAVTAACFVRMRGRYHY